MKIQEAQILEMKNVLSYRAKMTQPDMNVAISRIGQVMQDSGATKNGSIVTTTYSVEAINGQQVMDVELLVPLDRVVEVPEGYTFKPHFYLTNAMRIRHEGNPALLQESANAIMSYIAEKRAVPITSAYNVTVKDAASPAEMDSMIVDIYIGISPNRL